MTLKFKSTNYPYMSKNYCFLIFLLSYGICEIPKEFIQPRKSSNFTTLERSSISVETINILLRINFYVTDSDSQIFIKSRFLRENLRDRIVSLQDIEINYKSIEIIDKILNGRFLYNINNITRTFAIGNTRSFSDRFFIRPALLVNVLLAIEMLDFDKDTEDFLLERLMPYSLNFEHCVILDPACHNFTMTFSKKMFLYVSKIVDRVFMSQCKLEQLTEPSPIPIYSTCLMKNIETYGIIKVGISEMNILKKQNNDIFWKFWYLKGMSFLKDIYIGNYSLDNIDKAYRNYMSKVLNY